MYDYDMKQSRWDITAMWFNGKVFNRSRDVGMP